MLLVASGALMGGCVALQPNPEFRSCANSCTERQDKCMVSATTADEVSQCNATQDKCVQACESKFPRYLEP